MTRASPAKALSTFLKTRRPLQAQKIADRIRHFVDTNEALSIAEVISATPPRSRGTYQPDPERRKEVEDTAMKIVEYHFKKLKYRVQLVPELNLGYDIIATQADSVLCVEVKGRSDTTVIADFTFNEFDKIKLEQKGKFTDGSCRIYIVTDALNENGGARLHHFWCVCPTPDDKKRSDEPEWRDVNSSHVLKLKTLEAARGSL